MEEKTNLPWRSTVPNRFHGCGHDGHTDDPARRRALSRRDPRFRRHGDLHLPAGGGRARRRARDAGRRVVPALSLRRDLWPAQRARPASRARSSRSPDRAWPARISSTSRSAAYGSHGAMPQSCQGPDRRRDGARPGPADDRQPQRQSARSGRAVDHADSRRLGLQRHSRRGEARRHHPRLFRREPRADARAHARDLRRRRGERSTSRSTSTSATSSRCWSTASRTRRRSSPRSRARWSAPRTSRRRPSRRWAARISPTCCSAVPGAYFWLGHAGSTPVHNPGFVLDDEILPVGASLFARLDRDANAGRDVGVTPLARETRSPTDRRLRACSIARARSDKIKPRSTPGFAEQIAYTQELVRFASTRGASTRSRISCSRRSARAGWRWSVSRWTARRSSAIPARGKFSEAHSTAPIVVGIHRPREEKGRSLILQAHVDVVPPGPADMWTPSAVRSRDRGRLAVRPRRLRHEGGPRRQSVRARRAAPHRPATRGDGLSAIRGRGGIDRQRRADDAFARLSRRRRADPRAGEREAARAPMSACSGSRSRCAAIPSMSA